MGSALPVGGIPLGGARTQPAARYAADRPAPDAARSADTRAGITADHPPVPRRPADRITG